MAYDRSRNRYYIEKRSNDFMSITEKTIIIRRASAGVPPPSREGKVVNSKLHLRLMTEASAAYDAAIILWFDVIYLCDNNGICMIMVQYCASVFCPELRPGKLV